KNGSASRILSHELRLLAGPCFEDADIPLCSGLQVCSPPRSFLPLRILLQGSRGFYDRAYRALLPPHAPDMLTVRIQVIDGTVTFTLSDSQPCRLLTFLSQHYPASTVIRPRPTPAMAVAFRDVEAATLALDGSPPIPRTTFPTCRAHYPGGSSGCACRLLPRSCYLPLLTGGSASALSLSRCYGAAARKLHPSSLM